MQPTPSSPAVNAWRRYFQIGKVSEGVRFFLDGGYESLIVRNKALRIHTYTYIYIYLYIYIYIHIVYAFTQADNFSQLTAIQNLGGPLPFAGYHDR